MEPTNQTIECGCAKGFGCVPKPEDEPKQEDTKQDEEKKDN